MVNEKSRKTGKALDFVSLAFLVWALLELLALCASGARLLERDATAGTRPHSRVPSLLHLAAIACCFRRATAGPRPCVGKHSVRAFHTSAHAKLRSVLFATERRLAFAGCDNVVFVQRWLETHHATDQEF